MLFFIFHTGLSQSYLPFENSGNGLELLRQNSGPVLQDQRGYLWFGTTDGLIRYDGYTTTVFPKIPFDSTSIINNNVNAIYENKDGSMWFGTAGGLSKWSYGSGHFENFLLDPLNKKQFANYVITVAGDSAGAIWVGTLLGLFRLKKENGANNPLNHGYQVDSFLCNSSVYAIYFDEHNNGWIGTANGLYYLEAGQLKNKVINFPCFRHNDKDDNSMASGRVWQIVPDLHKNLWLLSYSDHLNGQRMLDKIDSSWVYHPSGEMPVHHYLSSILQSVNLPAANPYRMLIDSKNQLWMGTNNMGLFTCSLSDLEQNAIPRVEHYINDPNNKNSLAHYAVNSIYEDRQHVMWIATEDGISKYVPSHKFFNQKNFPSTISVFYGDSLNAITEDALENYWFGLKNNKVGIYNGSGFREIHIINSSSGKELLKSQQINHLLFLSNGILCLGTNDSDLFLIQKEQIQAVLNGKLNRVKAIPVTPRPGSPINVLWLDKTGNVLAGTNNSLLSVNPGTAKVKTLRAVKSIDNLALDYHIIDAVTDSRGYIWFGTDHGLTVLNLNSNDSKLYKYIPGDTTSILNDIQCLLNDDRNPFIWIGTANGLSRLDYKNQTIKNFTSKNGLSNSNIKSLLQDQHGNIWMGTADGLIKYISLSGKFNTYTSGDGLKSNEFIKNVAYKDKAGILCFGTKSGIITFSPDSLKSNQTPPPVYLSDFKIFNHSMLNESSLLRRQFEMGKSITLPYDSNFFSFEFVALNYLNTSNNNFKYILAGFDKDTSYVGSRRTADYTGVRPGVDTFKVWASNNNGVWNKTPNTIPITILPPWYETWWFRILLALAGIGMIISANILYTQYKLREQRMIFEKQQAIDRERSRIAGEMHDDLGSGLAAIRLISEMAKRKSTADELKNEIGKISESSSDLIQNMREIIWAMSSKNDKLESLIAYIRKYAFEFMEQAGIDCSVKMPDDIVDCDLAGEVRRNIFLVVKESLHNIVKHAGATRVEIGMQVHDDFSIIIHDNGRGINHEKMNQFGNGLKSMSDRMVSVGGRFEISSKQGTTINLKLPLQD